MNVNCTNQEEEFIIDPYQPKLSLPFMPLTSQIKTALWKNQAILLSQVINYRFCQPRQNERKYHSYLVIETAKTFNVEDWSLICPAQQLYHMSLTGHLIEIINMLGGKASLQTLVDLTQPFLPYLRRLNGKNFCGSALNTVNGCLQTMIFKRDAHGNCSLYQPKVEEFAEEANQKLINYLTKIKKNFPLYDKDIQQKKAIKKKSINLKTLKKLQLMKPPEIVKEEEVYLGDNVELVEINVPKLENLPINYLKLDKPVEDLKIFIAIEELDKLRMKTQEMEMHLPLEQIPFLKTHAEIMDYFETKNVSPTLLGYLIGYDMIQLGKNR